MEMNTYQELARSTAIYPHAHFINYPILGLVGEAGELANKWKKVLRDTNGVLGGDVKQAILDEVGDCMWYMANLVADLGGDLDSVSEHNIKKLKSRQERGVLGGSGDNR